MRARSIDPKRASSSNGLMTAAMLMATLIALDAAQAQERTPYIQPSAATVMAAVQPIDRADVGPGRASGKAVESPGEGTPQSSAGAAEPTDSTMDQATSSVTVSAAVRQSEPWDGFRHSVASAATPSCFSLDAQSHEEFAAEGLLRLPFLAHAAATSACR
jgi:hypothetical protein